MNIDIVSEIINVIDIEIFYNKKGERGRQQKNQKKEKIFSR